MSHVQTRLLSSSASIRFFIFHNLSQKPLKKLYDYAFDILLVIFEIQEFLTCCHKSDFLPYHISTALVVYWLAYSPRVR